jgi:hypothetical protein
VRTRNVVRLLLATSVSTAAVITACVGDEPIPSSPDGSPNQDGGAQTGSDGSTSSDASSSLDDGSPMDAVGDVSPPAPLDVRTLPGLRLWLESTKNLEKAAVGNEFVSWRDSSGRWADGGADAPDGGAHTALPVAYNGGGAVYPSVNTNGIAGRPSVTFESGPKIAVPNHADFDVGTGDFVIAAVAAVSSGSGPFWNLTTASTAPSGTWLSSQKFCSFLGGLGAQPKCTSPEYSPNTAGHVFVIRRKAAQAIYRVDGTSRATYDFGVENPDLGVQTFQQANAVIGGNVVAQLSELVVIIGPTADSDFDALEAYFKTKYSLP